MGWFRKKSPIKRARVIAVDFDGVLSEGECWTNEDVRNAKPRLDVIRKVNQLSLSKFIYILTARRLHLAEESIRWLNKHGVMYHAISHNKSPFDILIDDKVLDVKDFMKGG